MLWQIAFWLVGRNALLPPLETGLYLARLLQTARFWGHIAETGTAFVIALAIAIIAGLAIGLALGMNRTAAEVFEPFLLAGNSVPTVWQVCRDRPANACSGTAAEALKTGDRVWLRHTKAGELSEHLDGFAIVTDGRISESVPTYRGEGRAFL